MKIQKLIRALIYLALIVFTLFGVYVAIVACNTFDPKSDARYSSIDLNIDASPISQKLKNLMQRESSPIKDQEGLHAVFDQLKPKTEDSGVTTQDLNEAKFKITDELRVWFKDHQDAHDLYMEALLDDGCIDDLDGWDPRQTRKSSTLLLGAKLIATYIARDRQEGHPDHVVNTYGPLLRAINHKRRTCHQEFTWHCA